MPYNDLFSNAPEFNPADIYGRRAMFPTIQDEEQADSWLWQAAKAPLSALGYIGATLDKPGSAIRGVLAGDFDELLNLIPFSDALGISDPSDNTSGRDLLDLYGLTPRNEEGFHPIDNPVDAISDVAGFGVDVLTDPLTFLTLGGSKTLTEAGKAASKVTTGLSRTTPLPLEMIERIGAGQLTKPQAFAELATDVGRLAPTAQSQILAGQRNLFNVGLPFTEGIGIGSGETAAKIAGMVGGASDTLFRDNPVARSVRSLFDFRSGGTPDKLLQDTFEGSVLPNRASQRPLALSQLNQLEEFGLKSGALEDPAFLPLIRAGREQDAPFLQKMITNAKTPEEVAAMQRSFEFGASPQYSTVLDQELQRGVDVGRGPMELASQKVGGLPYHPRDISSVEGIEDITRPVTKGTIADLGNPAAKQRLEMFENLRTESDINDLAREFPEKLADMNHKELSKYILDTRYKRLMPDPDLLKQARVDFRSLTKRLAEEPMTQGERQLVLEAANVAKAIVTRPRQLKKYSRNFADYLQTDPMGNALASRGQAIFGNNPLADMESMLKGNAMQRASALANTEAVANAVGAAHLSGLAPDEQMPIKNILGKIGLGGGTVVDEEGVVIGATGAWDQLAKMLRVAPEELDNLYVSKDFAEKITQVIGKDKAGDATSPFLSLFDNLTSWWKSSVTSGSPSAVRFNVRNFFGGQYNNMIQGLIDAKTIGDVPLAYRMFHGLPMTADEMAKFKGILGEGLSGEEATRRMVQHAIEYDAIGFKGYEKPDQLVHGVKIPGQSGYYEAPSLSAAIPRSLSEANPLAIEGMPASLRHPLSGNRAKTDFSIAREGSKLTGEVEFVNRMSGWLGGIEKGMSPEVAAFKVREAQFDYGELSKFERDVMKRVLPFYTFARKNLPYQVKKILESPGGLGAQSIRAINESNQSGEYVPEYLRGGLTIPIGGPNEEGIQRYFTRTGLPIEAGFEPFQGGIKRTAQRIAGQANPLLRVPLEAMTGVQMFSGRQMEDLYSPTGSTGADQLLMGSPLSPYANIVRTIADTRQGGLDTANYWTKLLTNLGLGARLTDVDTRKTKDRDAEATVKDLLLRNPAVKRFEQLYVPREQAAALSSDDALSLRLLNTLSQRRRDARRDSPPLRDLWGLAPPL